MARYRNAKGKINRRLGAQIYESAGAVRAFDRRPEPPGMHTRPRKLSTYGQGLIEKQKIKHFYGIGERQLRRYFSSLSRKPGKTGELLLSFLECRLDNVVRKACLTRTRPQARQGIVHGHFLVNGRRTNKPSFHVRPGDVIQVRNRKNILQLYHHMEKESEGEPCDWMTVDTETLRISIQQQPVRSDISLPVDENMVVEFMSR